MRHFMTSLLALYWAVVFALLALVCVLEGDAGAAGVLNLAGMTLHGPSGGHILAALLSVLFAVVSVLFTWALLTSFIDIDEPRDDQVFRVAYGAAAVALSILLLVGAGQAATGILPGLSVFLAALTTSYVAACAERWSAVLGGSRTGTDSTGDVRRMAAGAAHNAMLTRLSGRADLTFEGAR